MISRDNILDFSKEEELEKHRKAINYDDNNISKLDFSYLNFNTIEYLSLQNTKLTDLSFLKDLINLWYLDIRNNNINDFKILNDLPVILGFLGITLNISNKNSFLNTKNHCIGILYANLDVIDDIHLNSFLALNNNNILKLNCEFIDKKYKLDGINEDGKINKENLSSMKKFLYNFFQTQNSLIIEMKSLNFSHLIKDEANYSEAFNFGSPKSKNSLKSFIAKNKLFYEYEKEKYLMYLKLIKSFFKIEKDLLNNFHSESSNPIFDFFNRKISQNKIGTFFHVFKNDNIETQVLVIDILILYFLNILQNEFASFLLKGILLTNAMVDDTFESWINIFLELDLESQISIFCELLERLMNLKKQKNPKYYNLFNDKEIEELCKLFQTEKLIININTLKQMKNHFNLISNKELNSIENENNDKNLKIFIKENMFRPIKQKLHFLKESIILLDILKKYIDNLKINENCNKFKTFIKENKNLYKNFCLTIKIGFKFFKKDLKRKIIRTQNNDFPEETNYPCFYQNLISNLKQNENEKTNSKINETSDKKLIEYFINPDIDLPLRNSFDINDDTHKKTPIRNEKKYLDSPNVEKISVSQLQINESNKIYSLNNSNKASSSISFNYSNKLKKNEYLNGNDAKEISKNKNGMEFYLQNLKIKKFNTIDCNGLKISEVRNIAKTNDFFRIEDNLSIDNPENNKDFNYNINKQNSKLYDSYFNSSISIII